MTPKTTRFLKCTLIVAVPVAVFAFSAGPPPARCGVPGDGGLDCAAYHRTFAPANSDARGELTIEALPYAPGAKQIIRVKLTHPEAQRWGFQLTARLAGRDTQQAGTFTVDDNIRVRCFDGTDSTRPGTTGGVESAVEWTPPSSDVGTIVLHAAGNMANDNGASFQAGISTNSMVTIFGSGFAARGTSRSAHKEDFTDGKFPTELSCVAVEVSGRRAPITFLSDTQINAEMPTTGDVGPVDIRVIVNPGRPTQMRSDQAGGAQAPLRNPVTIIFGGVILRPEDVVYGGLSPNSISGLYQFNVRIPQTVSNGDAQVAISIGGQTTHAGTAIPVKR